MSKVIFIVAEPSFIIRKGMVSLINELPNTTVARELESGQRIIDIVAHHSADAVVIGLDLLNNLSPNEVRKLNERKRKVFLIALTPANTAISEAVKSIASEKIALDEPKPSVIKKIKSVISQVVNHGGQPAEVHELSERETEILKDVALGLSNKAIAEKNFISPHTVITHRKNITRKLGIKTVSGLTIYAILNKLIGMEALE